MASPNTKQQDGLNLTQAESESMGVAFPEAVRPVPVNQRERPLHEQVAGALTEDDVVEAFTGEVTAESREGVQELFADEQEASADRQVD